MRTYLIKLNQKTDKWELNNECLIKGKLIKFDLIKWNFIRLSTLNYSSEPNRNDCSVLSLYFRFEGRMSPMSWPSGDDWDSVWLIVLSHDNNDVYW
jgi:hypothetical protein